MRAVYAVSFEFPERTDANKVLDCGGRWFCRGQAPEEVCTSWEPGRRSYPMPEDGHTLEVEVLESDEGRLWHGSWRHPHADDPDLHLVSDVEVGVVGDAVTLSLVIRAGWARAKVAPPRFDMRAPRLARTIVDSFDVRDADHPLVARAQVLDAAAVPDFIERLLLDHARTRPVVFVSDDPRRMGPNIDPGQLARELAGLAHVYTSVYGRPAWELGNRLGRLGCGDGGARIWWPGLTVDDDPFRHLLLTGHALRNWQGPDPGTLIFRRISTAAAMNAAPPAHARLRRAGRLAQAASATDADARDMLAYALDDNQQLADEVNALSESRDELELERDELAEKLRAAEEEQERLHRNYAAALAFADAEAAPEPVAEPEAEEPPLHNVRDAVDAARDRCPHLVFADSAFESADNSPFESPDDILDALMKLERLAGLWARTGGLGGMDLGQKAAELGLDWVPFVSPTTRSKYKRHYNFTWDGEKRTMSPHVRLGSGSGAGRIARIYLDKYEPDDAAERKLIVAHVGRKLPDTTTG